MGSDPRLAGLSEPLRLQAKQHPGGMPEETQQTGKVDAESLMGTQVAAANGWRCLESVFHSGVGVGWSMAKWGFISVRTLSELNIDLADSDSPSTHSMSTDWVPGARSLACIILSNGENTKRRHRGGN